MGRVTLYSDMLHTDYIPAERLRSRVVCCIDTEHPPLMHKEDWFTWFYTLSEISLKKLAVRFKLHLNSKQHNSQGIFFKLFMSDNKNIILENYIKDKLVKKYDYSYKSILKIITKVLNCKFDVIRYTDNLDEFIKELDYNLLRGFLDCISTLVLELETGKISIELEVP